MRPMERPGVGRPSMGRKAAGLQKERKKEGLCKLL